MARLVSKAVLFMIYQAGRHGLQSGFRLVLVEEAQGMAEFTGCSGG